MSRMASVATDPSRPRMSGGLYMANQSQSASSPASPICWSALANRRDLLRVGSMAIGSTFLPLGGLQPTLAAEDSGAARAKSVIVLWMAGGVTHIDSFDPKPDAIEEV